MCVSAELGETASLVRQIVLLAVISHTFHSSRGCPEGSETDGSNGRLAFEQPSGPGCKIAKNPVGAGPLERHEALQHYLIALEPSIGCSRHQDRILAGHLVDERGHAELVLHATHDVEVGHTRLYHHHVGAFGDVETHLAQR